MIKTSEQIITEECKSKAQDIIQNLQQEVEESFNRIDAQLDQLVNDNCNLIYILPSKLSSDIPKVNINKLQFTNDQFQNQINQEVTSLIETTTQIPQQTETEQHNNKLTIQQSSSLNLKPFTYQLMEQNSIKQDEYCSAIAVNKDCSILVAGCNSQIQVFEFKQAVLKLLQLLSEHTSNICTLNFMKKSDQFISGSDDESIIIWAKDQNNLWISQYKLNEHTNSIYCLIINDTEDLIISGSEDNTIKFWQKQNQWLCSQTITDHTDTVLGLCMDESQNKVISSGNDQLILVIEQSDQNKQWSVIQKIKVETEGVRLCFIDNNTFTFQPWEKEHMYVFEMNSTNKQYVKTKDIPLKCGPDNCFFPQQFIKSKCLLVNKNAENVNLIRKKLNGDFIIEQSIHFGTNDIYGYMTDDGQYLITWDDKTKEYQIRKYQEQ